ncbi:hypothetical protein M8I34_39300 [Streptomyces sp. MCA2]|uniref:hypothetical protein n=1 Tax=Streptomyces sp. MCA2 TaxID=2944805 RepID=UPI0020208546|nr:hypothetical protein [Streptomyces sp. MCA2]MCL7497408.1 hypothetical protein [Streptomyces sp. MCA2]
MAGTGAAAVFSLLMVSASAASAARTPARQGSDHAGMADELENHTHSLHLSLPAAKITDAC